MYATGAVLVACDFLQGAAHSPRVCVTLRRGRRIRHAFARYPADATALAERLRSIVHCSPRALLRAKGAGKLHRFAPLAPHSLLCVCLFARRYSSTSRHSKRVDARFAKRTVYSPPSGELVIVLIR